MGFSTVDAAMEYLNATLFASPRKDGAIIEAKCFVKECAFGDSYYYAVALLATHFLALDNSGDGTDSDPSTLGNIKKEKEDKLMIEFHSTGSLSSDFLNMTTYGSRYLMLRSSTIFMPRTRLMTCRQVQ